MSPEHAVLVSFGRFTLAAGGCKRRAVPGKRSLQGSKVDQKKLTPAASRAQSLRGPAIGRPSPALPVLGAWAQIIISSPSKGQIQQLSLCCSCWLQPAVRCNVERRHPRGESLLGVCVLCGEAARPL